MFRLDVLRAYSRDDVRNGLFKTLEGYKDLLPVSKTAKIFLKLNLNSTMNALTGNTTDLRVVAAVIEFLKESGYSRITIGDGTNSGFYRNGISVISRLCIDKLAKFYAVNVADLNYAKPIEIALGSGIKVGIAKECLETDFFINMPKIKTHFATGMSVCLKNMVGCLVGQENKRKIHVRKNLAHNIVGITQAVKSHLHIVDGLISMEGFGPTRGTPISTGLIMVGTDPYLIDLACARVASFDYQKVTTLKAAEKTGIITGDYHKYVADLDLLGLVKKFKEPKTNPLVAFIHHPKRQKYFLAIRNTALFNYLCSLKFIENILYRTGLRQDTYISTEMVFNGFSLNKALCKSGCTRCRDYCPTGLRLPDVIEDRDKGCIECLYCFQVCPTKAIGFKGILGFVAEQLRQYDEITRRVA